MYFCPECNGYTWRSLRRGKIYKCRKCGYSKGEGVKKSIPIIVEDTPNLPVSITIRKEVKLSWLQKLWQKIRN